MNKEEYKRIKHNVKLICRNAEAESDNIIRDINFHTDNTRKTRIVFGTAFTIRKK